MPVIRKLKIIMNRIVHEVWIFVGLALIHEWDVFCIHGHAGQSQNTQGGGFTAILVVYTSRCGAWNMYLKSLHAVANAPRASSA